MGNKGAKRSRGIISCLSTIWQKFPVHLCRRSDFERDLLARRGDPNVMQRICGGEGMVWM